MTQKITKRIFVLLLAAMLVFPLASCGGKAPEVNDPEPNTPVVSTPPETPVTVAPPAETPVTVVPPAETPVVPEPDPVDNSYADFVAWKGVLRNNDAEIYRNNIYAVLKTEEEMAEYYSYLSQELYNRYFSSYDAQFYQEKQLVVIAFETEFGFEDLSDTLSVRAVEEESGLVIYVDRLILEFDTVDASEFWSLVKPIDKDIEIGNPKEITVKYKNHDSYSEWLAAAQGKI